MSVAPPGIDQSLWNFVQIITAIQQLQAQPAPVQAQVDATVATITAIPNAGKATTVTPPASLPPQLG